jgi:hypothetical protein
MAKTIKSKHYLTRENNKPQEQVDKMKITKDTASGI